MTDVPHEVPAHETARLRLFGIDTETEEGRTLRDQLAEGERAVLTAALGATSLDADRVEVLSVKDLGGMTLPTYLAEGYDVPRDQLDAARDRLDAAPPDLLIVFSSAFGGQAQTLTPSPALRPIAGFDLGDPMPPRGPEPRYSDPAAPPDAPPAEDRVQRGALLVVTAIALGLLLLVIWALA